MLVRCKSVLILSRVGIKFECERRVLNLNAIPFNERKRSWARQSSGGSAIQTTELWPIQLRLDSQLDGSWSRQSSGE